MVEKDVEKMGQETGETDVRILLDTSVCIEIVRENREIIAALEGLASVTSAISSVTAFELMLRSRNVEAAESFITDTEVINFDKEAARQASEIAKDLKERGMPLDSHDVFIAATALSNKFPLATLDSDFSRIKGLRLVRLGKFTAGKKNQNGKFLHKIQQPKMKELWDNKEDEEWENA